MTTQKKLLVLVDGSERSIQTVNYVKAFMPFDGNMKIVLFHVYNSLREQYLDLENNETCDGVLLQLKEHETEQERKIRGFLKQAKEILIKGGFPGSSVEIKFHALEKGVARDIIEEAKNGYSAVVLRRRGMGALRSMILGSVAVKLLQSLTFIPIIIVGKAPFTRKIVLAVDSSPSSMQAVEFVTSLLHGHGYEISIFHAILGLGSINFDLSGADKSKVPGVEMAENCILSFKLKVIQLFQTIKERLIASGFEPEKTSEKIVAGVHSRSETIIRHAEESGYGTIVVGRRGLSRVEAFFMGRVGHKVVYGGKNFTVWVV